MNAASDPRRRLLSNADLWVIGIFFLLSLVPWLVALGYHGDRRVGAFALIAAAGGVLLVLAGELLARFTRARVFDWLARTAVLAIFLYMVAVQLRQLILPTARLGVVTPWMIAVTGLGLAAFGAWRLADVWPRLRAGLLVATLIGTTSPFALSVFLAPRLELLADSPAPRRPVVALLLDEFSAGSSQDLAAKLAERGLQVSSWALRSIGDNTIDAIPAIMTGRPLPNARPCTSSAVCGRTRIVDFARLRVARDDVDIVGIYHPYCDIGGLRSCVIQDRKAEERLLIPFLCALPLRQLARAQLGCDRIGYAKPQAPRINEMERELFGAPFWSRGGVLYAHLLTPHPPSVSGESRLADAYTANLARAEKLVLDVLTRLEQGQFRDEFAIVITSDHPLRVDIWCANEPYSKHDCDLPAAMATAEVPFIVATRGGGGPGSAPRSNADLMSVVTGLSRRP